MTSKIQDGFLQNLPSYYDLMRAFMALRDGESDHDLTAATGMTESDPDFQRVITCRQKLHELWILSLGNEAKAQRMTRLLGGNE